MGSGASTPVETTPDKVRAIEVKDTRTPQEAQNAIVRSLNEEKSATRTLTVSDSPGVRASKVRTTTSEISISCPVYNVYQCQVFEAASSGKLDLVASLVNENEYLLKSTTAMTLTYYHHNNLLTLNNVPEMFQQVTLLHVAAEKGNSKLIHFLSGKLDVDATAVVTYQGNRVTPLHIACYNGKLEATQALLDAGANVNFSETESSSTNEILMQRPIHLAVRNKQLAVIKVLLSKGAGVVKLLCNFSDPEAKIKVLENGEYQSKTILEITEDSTIVSTLKRAIENNYMAPHNSTVTGEGINLNQRVGTVAEITIVAKDKFKNPKKKGGDNVKIRFEDLETGSTLIWPTLVTDLKNGTYRVTYTPPKAGKFYIHVNQTNYFSSERELIHSTPIAQSPYRINVEAGKSEDDPSKVIPVRLHLGTIIAHTSFQKDTSFQGLQAKLQKEFEISVKPTQVMRLTYKNGSTAIQITDSFQLIAAIEHFQKSKDAKLELFVDV